ncbi:chromosomal replication initiator protein DnaA [Candidatus Babeliales bacterium]|nr:chromosomal replication initiator protein DnaA [Candidatus Babeliales bacterium]
MNAVQEQVWQDFLKIIKEEVGSRAVDTWIKAVTLVHYDSLTLQAHVVAPNIFVKNWVEVHYKDLFIKHLKRLFGVNQLHIVFSVRNYEASVPVLSLHESSKVVPAVQESAKKRKQELVKKFNPMLSSNGSGLNPLHTFDNFVVGANTQFAYASAQAVVEKLGTLYNPLLLYGSSGLGKTHLLHAMGNYVACKYQNLVVLYQTADRFISEFIQAVRFDSVAKFQAKYKDVDLFLIDDIQCMINKDQTQEIFFHIFNTMYESNKQIVLSCDTLPRYLGGLADRLKSRLEWGLIADLQMPTTDIKINILKHKAAVQGVTLDDSVAIFISQCSVQSVRELEGYLIRVLAYASLTGQVPTIEIAHKILGSNLEIKSVIRTVDFQMIINAIKKRFGYDLVVLRSKDRSKDISHVRQIVMYLMKHHTNKSLREISEFLHRKDHTTVSHAVARIEQLRKDDEKLAIFLKQLESEFV